MESLPPTHQITCCAAQDLKHKRHSLIRKRRGKKNIVCLLCLSNIGSAWEAFCLTVASSSYVGDALQLRGFPSPSFLLSLCYSHQALWRWWNAGQHMPGLPHSYFVGVAMGLVNPCSFRSVLLKNIIKRSERNGSNQAMHTNSYNSISGHHNRKKKKSNQLPILMRPLSWFWLG